MRFIIVEIDEETYECLGSIGEVAEEDIQRSPLTSKEVNQLIDLLQKQSITNAPY